MYLRTFFFSQRTTDTEPPSPSTHFPGSQPRQPRARRNCRNRPSSASRPRRALFYDLRLRPERRRVLEVSFLPRRQSGAQFPFALPRRLALRPSQHDTLSSAKRRPHRKSKGAPAPLLRLLLRTACPSPAGASRDLVSPLPSIDHPPGPAESLDVALSIFTILTCTAIGDVLLRLGQE